MLRPILFKIVHISQWSFDIDVDIDSATKADDITLYKACDNVDAAVKTLIMSAKKLFKWFKCNQMKDDKGRCYLILSSGDSN